MRATHLQPCVDYGYSEAAGDYRLNADEEAFSRRVSRSPFWRQIIANAEQAEDMSRQAQQQGPPTWTITKPAEADGETFSNASDLHDRLDVLRRAGHCTVSYLNNL